MKRKKKKKMAWGEAQELDDQVNLPAPSTPAGSGDADENNMPTLVRTRIPNEVQPLVNLHRESTTEDIIDGDVLLSQMTAQRLYAAWHNVTSVNAICKLARETMSFIERRRGILPNAPQPKTKGEDWLKPIR